MIARPLRMQTVGWDPIIAAKRRVHDARFLIVARWYHIISVSIKTNGRQSFRSRLALEIIGVRSANHGSNTGQSRCNLRVLGHGPREHGAVGDAHGIDAFVVDTNAFANVSDQIQDKEQIIILTLRPPATLGTRASGKALVGSRSIRVARGDGAIPTAAVGTARKLPASLNSIGRHDNVVVAGRRLRPRRVVGKTGRRFAQAVKIQNDFGPHSRIVLGRSNDSILANPSPASNGNHVLGTVGFGQAGTCILFCRLLFL
mmetsp:Transcript_3374/g.7053  ORF Transcript_3374/g.7053 Transcript_3374/m.7053 type:complete len:258 (-) Transcript_3374:201-974(-)